MFTDHLLFVAKRIGLLVVVVLAACAPVTGGSGLTQTPGNPPATPKLEEATRTPVGGGVTCPENQIPTDAPKFDDVQEIEAPDLGIVYAQTGTYTNSKNGQTFLIKVTGRISDVVKAYISNLRVCFEVIAALAAVDEKLEAGEAGESTEDFLKDANSEDLAIEFEVAGLPPEQEKAFQEAGGATLIAVIDPSIAQKARHCYRRDGAVISARLWMESGANGGQGTVRGFLSNQSRVSGPAVTAVAPNNTPVAVATPNGSATRYGLTVQGNNASNRYRVSGQWQWTVSYLTPQPTLAPSAGCP